jgi:hypothetical protein
MVIIHIMVIGVQRRVIVPNTYNIVLIQFKIIIFGYVTVLEINYTQVQI